MNQDLQLKLQAYLDGELPESEAREVEASLPANAEARALLAELRNTSGALAGFEAGIKLPESREFYWSKIRREIERQETAPATRSAIPWWRRILIPSGAFAALVIAGLLAVIQLRDAGGNQPVWLETSHADSGTLTYRDEAEKMTLVWLSYPGENEFADTDGDDTIQ